MDKNCVILKKKEYDELQEEIKNLKEKLQNTEDKIKPDIIKIQWGEGFYMIWTKRKFFQLLSVDFDECISIDDNGKLAQQIRRILNKLKENITEKITKVQNKKLIRMSFWELYKYQKQLKKEFKD
jgi:DNA-binding protein YbaB